MIGVETTDATMRNSDNLRQINPFKKKKKKILLNIVIPSRHRCGLFESYRFILWALSKESRMSKVSL